MTAPEHRAAAAAQAPAHDTLTPADRYEELFTAVQSQRVFHDSKTFVDCAPSHDPHAILAAYRAQKDAPGFDLARFVHDNFRSEQPKPSDYVSPPGQPLVAHIDSLWPVLTRHPHRHPLRSSLLRLPHDYVVPGGRFGELYYWDSYFTMIGIAASGRHDLVHSMTDNFAYLIDEYGHVPNGTRTYYLSRSQPPLFWLMTELCERCGGPRADEYLAQLRKEHAWWMEGAESLRPGESRRRVVRLEDGSLLNRYWDDRDTPREEAWLEDVTTARQSDRPAAEVYRDLRAAAESGWDFGTRWLAESDDDPPQISTRLADIRTTSIVPVDLNAFLCGLESKLGELSAASGDARGAEQFRARAGERRDALLRLTWDASRGAFFDYDFVRRRRRHGLTAACAAPLFAGMAEAAQARALARTLERDMLAPGGLATSGVASGEQWDRPNGWAPLQWMAIRGLAAYGHADLAHEIARRWLATVEEVYRHEAKLVEKYALRQVEGDRSKGGGGGEYALQDGFGWTNGVTRRLL